LAWGLVLTVAVYLSAPMIGELFGDARAVPVTRALSLGLLLNALGSTHAALLYRGLAFQRRIVPDVTQVVIRGVVSIALAIGGWGYWSLVVGQLAGQAGFCVTSWILQPFRPRLEWDRGAARWLLGYGSAVVGSQLVVGLGANSAFFIVASELGAVALGLFTLGYRVPEILLLSTFKVLSVVLFPVYSRLQEDRDGLRRAYLLAQRYMALIALPIGLGVVLVAPLFVHLFYGFRWTEAAPIMQLLTARSALSVIGWGIGDITKATGRARLHLQVSLIPVVIFVPAMLVAARSHGLVGLAIAYSAGTLLTIIVQLVMAQAVVGVSIPAVLRELEPALLASAAVLIGAGSVLLLAPTWPEAIQLIVAVATGAAAYACVLLVVGRDMIGHLPIPPQLRRALGVG
jgi:O-antigen/teichoic acid export membrane protein